MTELRSFVRWLWAQFLWYSRAIFLVKRRLDQRGAVVVVAFHRVLDAQQFPKVNSLPAILMRRRTFEQLISHVASRFDILDLARTSQVPQTGLHLAFTFDDGWQDNYANAFPVAREFGIPITIFICPGLTGQDSPFWPEQVASSLRGADRRPLREAELEAVIEGLKCCAPEKRALEIAGMRATFETVLTSNGADRTLSWDEISEMHEHGVSFGSHTQSHQLLTEIPETAARKEIFESKLELETKLAEACRLFAYPNGNCSSGTRGLVAEAGFAFAFTVKAGAWTSVTDPLVIPRVNLSESAVVGPTGRFSAALFEYTVFWRASRASDRAAGHVL